MNSSNNNVMDGTPKRRRLGLGRLRSNVSKSSLVTSKAPLSLRLGDNVSSANCESPPLPCNQVEYLSDSHNTSASIPCSPGILESSIFNDFGNWDSLTCNEQENPKNDDKEMEDVSEEMFNTRLELETTQNHSEKKYREDIEQCFDVVNQSICNVVKDTTFLDTKDSFLLDIKDSGLISQQDTKSVNKCNENTFYGLPIIAKGLFKTYRNIEKFYDWQEECLNLPAIKERHNLIYALPTSGGKTLVAEVLMLREVLIRKHNALFILPFVAIVQEKIWSLSPFALQMDFLVEEYAAGKGHIPPKKRRKKNSIYIATIEKGLALVRSLIELDRLHEIGLIVVDELHLIGEPGRGATLEILLTSVLFANKGIQVVGMSATIGNLDEVGRFLRATVYQRQFRPVQLTEYVKLGGGLHRLTWTPDGVDVEPDRELNFNYSAAGERADPERVGGLVGEVVPAACVLLFCATKRHCESLATLLAQMQRKEMVEHRAAERRALAGALRAEGAGPGLARLARAGLAYHHAGLAHAERALLEDAFRSGVISVLCCTSTLAAGVNLPAQRVIVRSPRVGRDFFTLGAYRQMVGRAGRAGVCEYGESILIVSPSEWPRVREILQGGVPPARSHLLGPGGPAPPAPPGGPGAGEGGECAGGALGGLFLSAVALGLATTRCRLRELLGYTFLAVAPGDKSIDMNWACDETLRSLLQSGAVEVRGGQQADGSCLVYNDTTFAVSALGNAAVKGCIELSVARQMVAEMEAASRGVVLQGGLHLLFLLTPHDAAHVRPDRTHYYTLYRSLDEEGARVWGALGAAEADAVRMLAGKPSASVPESVLCRFYIALMLRDLWRQMPISDVAEKYNVPRGTAQTLLRSASSRAAAAERLCGALPRLWAFAPLLAELALRLRHAADPDLARLMDLPAVKKARALQLSRAGFKRIEDVARASVDELVAAVTHLSRTAAAHLVSSARMMLIEKVENLRAEAEDVMEELNA